MRERGREIGERDERERERRERERERKKARKSEKYKQRQTRKTERPEFDAGSILLLPMPPLQPCQSRA